ncbi:MAG: branched-chain amino acid ABC transporter permease [Anaerolineaceae bacterium]|nr:branched-chain amino acid ABC transporter permease [Anaerolineaceae bacterium]
MPAINNESAPKKTSTGYDFSKIKKDLSLLIFLAVLVMFPFIFGWITGTSPVDGPSKYWQGQLITFFILAVYAMSYDLLIGYTGILSFGHAAFYGSGAYTIAIFYKHIVPRLVEEGQFSVVIGSIDLTEAILFIFVLLIVCLICILLGLLFGAVAIRVKGVYFAMITLAMADALYILSKATDFVKWTGADEGLHGIPVPEWINPNAHRLRFYFIALIFLVFIFLLLRRIVNSPTGKVFVAIRENESRSKMIGYNPGVYRTMAFIVSGVIAGLAGSMSAVWNLGATTTMTSSLTTINALIITILGGMGTLIGPVLGSGIMQLISQFFYQWFGPRWPLVFGLLFILLVMFLPHGIVGTWRRKKPEWKAGWGRMYKLLKTNEEKE